MPRTNTLILPLWHSATRSGLRLIYSQVCLSVSIIGWMLVACVRRVERKSLIAG